MSKLDDGKCKISRTSGKQIALFRRGDTIYACNNRCPHEGYPLSEGDRDEVGEYLAAAINRFLNSPLKRKQARRTAHQALKFVSMDG